MELFLIAMAHILPKRIEDLVSKGHDIAEFPEGGLEV